MEVPAFCVVPPRVLQDEISFWFGEVELRHDVEVPEEKILVIAPNTNIYGVYEYSQGTFSPQEWKIIVKGTLIASGEANKSIVFNSIPNGLSSLKVPVNPNIKKIHISPQEINTKKIKEEFSAFRIQYIILWGMLFTGIYLAIRTR